jgi:Peptidase A4 family
MRLRSMLLGVAGGLAMLAGAGTASADTTTSTSSNWAGYAVHGTTFKKVIGRWTVPSATCEAGEATYSASWVGIGGYSADSDALEQIGTELDCTAAGKVKSTAWMELVPATSKDISVKVSPGNVISAEVEVSGHRVTLELENLTTHKSFDRTVTASAIDTSSAEWIVEAPSVCSSSDECETLPLADFATTSFSRAKATSTSGHTGTITDSQWDTTKIALESDFGGPGFISERQGSDSGSATASALSAGGSAFSVSYETTTQPTGPVAETTRRDVRASSSDTRLMPALRLASPAGRQ